jgi:ABC-type phosphate/phosphonate transport system substrate-binding protein
MNTIGMPERLRSGRSGHRPRNISPLILKSLLVGLLIVMVMLLQPSVAAADQGDGLPRVLRVGLFSRIFIDIAPQDAQVAVGLWAREMARVMGINSSVQVIVLPDSPAMSEAIRRESIDIVTLPAVEYLKIRDTVPICPLFVSANNVGRGREHILIARRDSGISTFSDLRGKTMALLPFSKHESSHIWLDVLLMREGKRHRASYFRQVKESPSASHAIMAVFFRQIDAAIVSRVAYETCVALNPQLGRLISVVAQSGSLAGEITCTPATTSEKMKLALENAAMQMHKTSMGKQMFVLFHMDRIIPYHPSYLDGLTELLKEQARLKAKPAKRR